MIRRSAAAAALALAAAACGDDARPAPSPRTPDAPTASAPVVRFAFTDVAAQSGLDFVSWCGREDKPHLLESGGNGVAFVDYDADGKLDVFLTSGWRLQGAQVAAKPGNRLYRNTGDGRFVDVTDAAGLRDDAWANGVAVGDHDRDGKVDLFVTNFGPDALWRNEGGGRFARVAGFVGIDGWSTGACFFDADGDGWDDLYVAAYCDVTLDEVLQAKPTLDWKGTKVMKGPFGLPGKADRFFRNDKGRLVDATGETGLVDVGEYYGFAVAAFDADDDGALDLFVANDSNPQYFFKSDGKGRFTESGLWCGAALSCTGVAQAGMGVGVGDYDGDGRPDFLLTTFADDSAALYRGLGRALFRDDSVAAGLRDPTFKPLKWGTVLADFDLDGDEDAFIACGHIYPQADTAPQSATTFKQTSLLLENVGARFEDASARAGPGLAEKRSSRGVAAGDYDDDGDVDLLISNVDAPPTLLRNDAPRAGRHWLTVDAPGARKVVVEAGGRKLTRFFVAGGSYCSASDPRFHFGLGEAAKAERVVVSWRRGGETVLENVASDKLVRVKRP